MDRETNSETGKCAWSEIGMLLPGPNEFLSTHVTFETHFLLGEWSESPNHLSHFYHFSAFSSIPHIGRIYCNPFPAQFLALDDHLQNDIGASINKKIIFLRMGREMSSEKLFCGVFRVSFQTKGDWAYENVVLYQPRMSITKKMASTIVEERAKL